MNIVCASSITSVYVERFRQQENTGMIRFTCWRQYACWLIDLDDISIFFIRHFCVCSCIANACFNGRDKLQVSGTGIMLKSPTSVVMRPCYAICRFNSMLLRSFVVCIRWMIVYSYCQMRHTSRNMMQWPWRFDEFMQSFTWLFQATVPTYVRLLCVFHRYTISAIEA